ncbi:hypothetical protein C8J56DRAFT_921177 [Mycena floridula]|nr:hypothetical protein C8J56DRAFT_921177 [Mycena floridula]
MDTDIQWIPRDLPGEIVHCILEAMVEVEPRKTLDLMLLSWGILSIIEPLLYRAVTLRTTSRLRRFNEMLRSGRRPRAFYQRHVRSICIAVDMPCSSSQLSDILYICTNLHSLAVWLIDSWPDFQGSLVPSRPKRLSCTKIDWENPNTSFPDFTTPFFQSITHLELASTGPGCDGLENLHHLPQLTHLSLIMPFITSVDAIKHINLIPTIVVGMLSIPELRITSFTAEWFEAQDPRIVLILPAIPQTPPNLSKYVITRSFMLGDDQLDFIKNWGGGERREPDLWARAEAIVRASSAARLGTART